VLEITERGVPDRIGVEALNSRPRRGVLVALDDVCASRASFLVASRVHVDILKIDKPTVERLTRRELPVTENAALTELIRAADVTVVAEGVESAEQVGRLRGCGIEAAQGFLFSRPLSAEDFRDYFAAHRGTRGAGTERRPTEGRL
jgi:EAL domain-containing protein (putative c-di-GMP-specific phosphodiesterase class I)